MHHPTFFRHPWLFGRCDRSRNADRKNRATVSGIRFSGRRARSLRTELCIARALAHMPCPPACAGARSSNTANSVCSLSPNGERELTALAALSANHFQIRCGQSKKLGRITCEHVSSSITSSRRWRCWRSLPTPAPNPLSPTPPAPEVLRVTRTADEAAKVRCAGRSSATTRRPDGSASRSRRTARRPT